MAGSRQKPADVTAVPPQASSQGAHMHIEMPKGDGLRIQCCMAGSHHKPADVTVVPILLKEAVRVPTCT